MKKIIPSVIFTVAAAASTILYIKKKFIEKNEIKLIELEEDVQKDDTNEEIQTNDTAETSIEVNHPLENEGKQEDIVEESNDDLTEEPNVEETKVDEIQETDTAEEIPSENTVDKVDDIAVEEIQTNDTAETSIEVNHPLENEDKQEDIVEESNNDLTEEPNVEETKVDEIQETDTAEEIPSENETENTVNDITTEEIDEQRINDEINDIIDEIIQPQDDEEEISDEQEQQLLNEDKEEIEQAISDEQIELEPLENPTDELKIVDENKADENLIDDIVNSLDEPDQNQQAVDDIEDLIDDEIEEVKEEDMTDEELVEKYSKQYPNITTKKIDLILKQIRLMQQSVGQCESISLLHYALFDNEQQKEAYKAVAQIEGYEIETSDNENGLNLNNVVENNRLALNHSILALASNIGEYKGSYRGWAVKTTM